MALPATTAETLPHRTQPKSKFPLRLRLHDGKPGWVAVMFFL
jgi:hypothetical protein